MANTVSINLEFTPNPNTLKFVTSVQFLERGAANFLSKEAALVSPLATALLEVTGIQGVLIGTNFVTVTKGPNGDWDTVADAVPRTIELFVQKSLPFFGPDWKPETPAANSNNPVEQRIREILDSEIRPAVAMDGGDISFAKFEDGIVYLQLQGACSSCPSSIATLKMGVETRLKEAIPEVKEVVQV